jgi:hypothetical protein
MMAIQITLSLPELLEKIIFHLPERDLFCNVQRVSHHWKNVINNSPTIQKKLRFQSVDQQPAVRPTGYVEDNSQRTGSPIFSRTFVINPRLKNYSDLFKHFSQASVMEVRIIELAGGESGHVNLGTRLMVPPPADYGQKQGYGSSLGSPSSTPTWRNMYLSQPPVTTAILSVSYYYRTSRSQDLAITFEVMIRDQGGITVGLMYDTFLATLAAYDASLRDPKDSAVVRAWLSWLEIGCNVSKGYERLVNQEDESVDGSGDDSGEDDRSGDEKSGDQKSVVCDSDGDVLEESGSET